MTQHQPTESSADRREVRKTVTAFEAFCDVCNTVRPHHAVTISYSNGERETTRMCLHCRTTKQT